MKVLVCTCMQCRWVRFRYGRKGNGSGNKIQTHQVRAARSRVKRLLKTHDPYTVEDVLPKKVSVDYYG